MKASDFKAQFIAVLPALPPGLNLRLKKFIAWQARELPAMDEQDTTFLVHQGLPAGAAPFLSFAVYDEAEAARRLATCGIIDHYFPLGHTGCGDVLALDCKTREVVYFNHDANNERVFINTTLMLLAQCLCLFQRHLRDNTLMNCLAQIEHLDPAAAATGTMWADEVSAELG